MIENDFLPSKYTSLKQTGTIRWKSPSNIALVKYWGKRDNQIPANPSLSFTLDACVTDTTVTYRKLKGETTPPTPDADGFRFDLLFGGESRHDFRPKIATFFKRIEKFLPFLREYHLRIETSNSFPHSSGIASSASGMSALALCLMSMEREFVSEMDDNFFKKKASFLARLGSGSACRSIEGPLVQWGSHSDIDGSSDFYGIPYPYKIHENFTNFQDTILLVDEGQKQVSSSVGHDLMHGHPFADQRFEHAYSHLSELRSVLAEGNLRQFIKITESEALTLHAMMMTSHPYFMLMKPNTLEIIDRIWEFRKASATNVCFTLDAGANVHVLYPEEETQTVYGFIKDELLQYCENGKHIRDRTGFGARKIKA
ncbi:diphosphomevalonate decarboxylase [Pricia sp. S334]|uniref:Diphosphomevalonate decarboxylase n=1 Tax=Pricia mediterranea TaxID=3076079 RepID=A0ABU3L825_9FLAO|nr:diphosphomevalonate decarboxylase [Pricia sp. S334]MDT7829212.1 diphosphomevalonate decarboxylase [Pricia sp. S334]